MTIFADASALVTIVAREAEALALVDCLDADERRLCSALSVWETVAGLARSYMFSVPSARVRVRLFLDTMDFSFVGIGEREFDMASEAYAQFGKGRHPAALDHGRLLRLRVRTGEQRAAAVQGRGLPAHGYRTRDPVKTHPVEPCRKRPFPLHPRRAGTPGGRRCHLQERGPWPMS